MKSNGRKSILIIMAIVSAFFISIKVLAANNKLIDPLKIYQSTSFSKDVNAAMIELNEAYPEFTQLEYIGTSVLNKPILLLN